MSTFFIEQEMQTKEDSLRQYFVEKPLPFSVTIQDDIESLCFIEERGFLVIIRKKGKYIAIYDTTNFNKLKEFKFWMAASGKKGQSKEDIFQNSLKYCVMCCTNIPEKSMIAFSLSNRTILFVNYDCEKKSVKIVNTSDTHHCMKWIPQLEALATAGLSGLIYYWNISLICSPSYVSLNTWDKDYQNLLLLNSPWFQGTPITDILFLTQFQYIATASSDKNIRIWDVSSLCTYKGKEDKEVKDQLRKSTQTIFKPIKVLKGHKNSIRRMVECPESKILVSIAYERLIYIWNPKSDAPIEKLRGHDDYIIDISYPSYAGVLVSIDVKSMVKVWSLQDYSCVQTIGLLSAAVTGLYSLPDSKRILVSANILHSLEFVMILPINDSSTSPIMCSDYSDKRDEIYLVDSNTIVVFDAITNNLKSKFSSVCDSEISYLGLDQSHRHLLVGESNGTVKLIDAESGATVVSDSLFKKDVVYIYYSNTIHWVISVSSDGSASIKTNSNVATDLLPKIDVEYTGLHKEEITAACYSEDYNLLLTASRDMHVKLWNIDQNRLEIDLPAGFGEIKVVSFLSPLPLFFVSDNDGRLMIWNIKCNEAKRYECLCEWYNAFNLTLNVPVTAATHFMSKNKLILIIGDMKGFITVYDITLLLDDIRPHLASYHKAIPRAKRLISNKLNELPNEIAQESISMSTMVVCEKQLGKDVKSMIHKFKFDQSMIPQIAKSPLRSSHCDMVTKLTVSERSNGLLIFSSSYDKNSKIWKLCDELSLVGVVNLSSTQWKYKPYEKKQTKEDLDNDLKKAKDNRLIKPKHSISSLDELDILIEPGEVISTNEVVSTIKDLDKKARHNLDESIHYGKVLRACKKKAVFKRSKKI